KCERVSPLLHVLTITCAVGCTVLLCICQRTCARIETLMLKRIFLCLAGEELREPAQPGVQPTVQDGADDKSPMFSGVDSHWQALYDSLHTIQGAWLDRLARVASLTAKSAGAAFASIHLYCPQQACFVVISCGGPQSEILQPGEFHVVHVRPNPGGPTKVAAGQQGTGFGTAPAPPQEVCSLELLLQSKAPLVRILSPSPSTPVQQPAAATAANPTASDPFSPSTPPSTPPPPDIASVASPSQLPPDWQRLHARAQLTQFASFPILDPQGAVIAALCLARNATPATSSSSNIHAPCAERPTPAHPPSMPRGVPSGQGHSAHAVTTTSTAGGATGCRGDGVCFAVHVPVLQRLSRVLSLAFFSDPHHLGLHQAVGAAIAGVQRAESLQGSRCVVALADTMEARVAYFAPLASSLSSSAAAASGQLVAPSSTASTATTSTTPHAHVHGRAATAAAVPSSGSSSSAQVRSLQAGTSTVAAAVTAAAAAAAAATAAGAGSGAVGACCGAHGSATPLQGVLGPLLDTLLLEVVSQQQGGGGGGGGGAVAAAAVTAAGGAAAAAGLSKQPGDKGQAEEAGAAATAGGSEVHAAGAVVLNCRTYLHREDRPGRDVQVCFQLTQLPPACLLLAVAGAHHSTLAPDVAVYVCTAQQQLPAGWLGEVRQGLQELLQLLAPHIHRQLLGSLAAEWATLRLQATAPAGTSTPLLASPSPAAASSAASSPRTSARSNASPNTPHPRSSAHGHQASNNNNSNNHSGFLSSGGGARTLTSLLNGSNGGGGPGGGGGGGG
ncbi:hypothetical protein Agub_g2863, partial [Astrephomene gubernaculifera]